MQYAPYKPGSKGTLAERARELGLEPLAMKLITPPGRANLYEVINPNIEGNLCWLEISLFNSDVELTLNNLLGWLEYLLLYICELYMTATALVFCKFAK